MWLEIYYTTTDDQNDVEKCDLYRLLFTLQKEHAMLYKNQGKNLITTASSNKIKYIMNFLQLLNSFT